MRVVLGWTRWQGEMEQGWSREWQMGNDPKMRVSREEEGGKTEAEVGVESSSVWGLSG
jgi:hypothetical protein